MVIEPLLEVSIFKNQSFSDLNKSEVKERIWLAGCMGPDTLRISACGLLQAGESEEPHALAIYILYNNNKGQAGMGQSDL